MGLRDYNLTGCTISGFDGWNTKNTMTIARPHVHEAIFSKLEILEVAWILNDLCKDYIILVLASNNIE